MMGRTVSSYNFIYFFLIKGDAAVYVEYVSHDL